MDIRKRLAMLIWTNVQDADYVQRNVNEETPSEFNRGLGNRPAIYTPFAQAIPNVPVIIKNACIKFKTGKVGCVILYV